MANRVTIKLGATVGFKWEKLIKGTPVQLSVTVPDKKTYKFPTVKLVGTAYASSGIKFMKKGKYLVTITAGKSKRIIPVTVN